MNTTHEIKSGAPDFLSDEKKKTTIAISALERLESLLSSKSSYGAVPVKEARALIRETLLIIK